jgi:hypothetical protein
VKEANRNFKTRIYNNLYCDLKSLIITRYSERYELEGNLKHIADLVHEDFASRIQLLINDYEKIKEQTNGTENKD